MTICQDFGGKLYQEVCSRYEMHAPFLEQSSSSHYRDDKLRTSNMTSKSLLQPKSVSEKNTKSLARMLSNSGHIVQL